MLSALEIATVVGLVGLALAALVLWLQARDRVRAEELEAANAALRREVEERRRAEGVLRASEARLRALMANFPNGAVFLVDRDLRYLVADGQALAPAGLSRASLEGKTLAESLHPEDLPTMEGLYRATLAGTAPEKVEIAYGDKLYTDYPVAVRDESGAIVAAMIISVDVTDVRRAEEEKRRIEQKLSETQRLESLGVLAGGVAHDFNNLLAAILGNAEVLRFDLPPDSAAQKNVDAIISVTRRAAELVKQMLAYAGRAQVARRPLQINDLIRDTRELLRACVGKHARLHHELSKDLPAALADPAQVRQIVMNLLVNASEAIDPATGGTIIISTAVDHLGQADLERLAPGDERPPGLYVRLTVADTGCGMDAETLARIFDPFFTTRFIGRGLGLAAVHGIVRSHGGALSVTSEPGCGTTFHVWLPAAATPAAPEPARRTALFAPVK